MAANPNLTVDRDHPKTKQPFDRYTSAISQETLHAEVCYRTQQDELVLHPDLAWIPSWTEAEAKSFGRGLYLREEDVQRVVTTAPVDKGEQIKRLILTWSESRKEERKGATLYHLLEVLHIHDEIEQLEDMCQSMSVAI